MSILALLLPDLALIVGGFLLARATRWGGEFWAGIEKLTYFVLFPALLFYSNARARIDLATAGPLVGVVLAAIAAGIALGLLGKLAFRPSPRVFAAGFQCAFRFNSYIALALGGRLFGDPGLAAVAVVIGVTVPIATVVAVAGFAGARGVSIAREIATNPLVVALVAGVAWGAAGLPLPEVAQTVLGRLGAASLVLGLLAVGAALDPTPPRAHKAFVAYILAVKLVALPAVAWGLGRALALPAETVTLAVAYAALPTASAAYIMAVRLGGDGAVASTIISYGVAASLVTLPLWLAAVTGT